MYRNVHSKKTDRSEFLLLSGEGRSGLNHFKYWIPELLKAKVSFSILIRRKDLFTLVQKEYRMLNILLAESALDVEDTLTKMSRLRAIFFMSNPSNNIHILRFNSYKHVFLGSENSDRDAEVTKILRAYDELWLTSQASIDKLKSKINTEHLVIKEIGKPQFREVFTLSRKTSSNYVLIVVSSENNIYSNSNFLARIMNSIPEGLHLKIVLDSSLNKKNVLFKDLKTQLNEFNWINSQNCNIYDSLTDDLIIEANYLICDINSYQQKFLAADALICMYAPNNVSLETLFESKYISFEGISRFSSEDELKIIFNNFESLYAKQKEFSEYWLGNSYTVKNEFIKNLHYLSATEED